MSTRIDAFHALSDHPWYGRLYRRLGQEYREIALRELGPIATLPRGEYETRINRLFLGTAQNKKHHLIAELLLSLRDVS